MKKLGFVLILGLVVAVAMMAGCGGKKKVEVAQEPVEPEPEVTVDTTTLPPPPPTPPPTLKESQFKTVYFDFDKSNLRPDAREALEHDYNLMVEFPSAIIKIEGHCDERDTPEYNLSLGERRARACRDYLVERGIAQERVSIISYGEERPADPGHNEAAWAKNRRCEFRVLSQ